MKRNSQDKINYDLPNKYRYGYIIGAISVVINLVITIIKFIAGLAVNSIALITDAVHSLSDIVTSLLLIIGFRVSAKVPDYKHPFGHGRAERIVSIIIASALILIGFEFAIQGINRLLSPRPVAFRIVIIIFLCATVIIKELLAQLSFYYGKRISSSALSVDAWHHRSDALSTIFVIAGFFLFRAGYYYVDGILSIIIAGFIIWVGIEIIRESSSWLLGEAPSSSFINEIKMIALQCEGVSDVHHIHVHDYGDRCEITVHVRLKRDMALDQVHSKATEVEECLKKRFKDAEFTVHPEPEQGG